MPTSTDNSLAAFVGLVLLVFAVAFLLPATFLALENPEERTLNQDLDTLTTVKSPISSLITNIDPTPAPGSVNITISNTDTGETVTTGPIDEGQTTSVTINSQTINVTNQITYNSNEALISYDYPVYIGWPEGVKTLFNNLLLLFIFGILFFILGMLLIIIEVFKQ